MAADGWRKFREQLGVAQTLVVKLPLVSSYIDYSANACTEYFWSRIPSVVAGSNRELPLDARRRWSVDPMHAHAGSQWETTQRRGRGKQ